MEIETVEKHNIWFINKLRIIHIVIFGKSLGGQGSDTLETVLLTKIINLAVDYCAVTHVYSLSSGIPQKYNRQ